MGSALPYDDTHDNDKLVDCDVCGKRFLLYKDKVPTCIIAYKILLSEDKGLAEILHSLFIR